MTFAEAEKRYLPWLLQNLPGFLAVVDLSATIRYISPSVERVIECRHESLIGRHISHLVHPDDLMAASQVLLGLSSYVGMKWSVVFRARGADGAWRTLHATATVRDEAGWPLAIVICRQPDEPESDSEPVGAETAAEQS